MSRQNKPLSYSLKGSQVLSSSKSSTASMLGWTSWKWQPAPEPSQSSLSDTQVFYMLQGCSSTAHALALKLLLSPDSRTTRIHSPWSLCNSSKACCHLLSRMSQGWNAFCFSLTLPTLTAIETRRFINKQEGKGQQLDMDPWLSRLRSVAQYAQRARQETSFPRTYHENAWKQHSIHLYGLPQNPCCQMRAHTATLMQKRRVFHNSHWFQVTESEDHRMVWIGNDLKIIES